MKIAILHCRKASDVCTGASCFRAYNMGAKAFARYETKPELIAFFDCGGCECDWDGDPGMREKMDRLVHEGVKSIHIGVCIGNSCPKKKSMEDTLRRNGFTLVEGTH